MSDIALSPKSPATPLDADASTSAAPIASAATSRPDRVRKKLDLSQGKRGAFSVLMGTLSKAKKEDKQRNASEAAQKRVLLEKRLHAKLARETTSVRRAEQSKRDKITASKKEEDLATKEKLVRHRYNQLPHLAGFLLSSDRIDTDLSSLSPHEVLRTLQPPRKSGTPHQQASVDSTIFYLPVKFLPWQEELIAKRSALVKDAVQKEWAEWKEERIRGLEEVEALKKQAEELAKILPTNEDDEDLRADAEMKVDDVASGPTATPAGPAAVGGSDAVEY
ncbi:hypothetical protein M408DRAFT_330303 [Serendipita vermifera MAFF 305830]|uniref:Pinin/SDK/MemA protein domain-containing protein n=1 Tax=Serendipita vermifera MAFF 305830 TaxID=933852 RepID=A0A0C3B405_SERVB|nr:hypothetical protein M408DRAFT_330303 [Serendipita vermifera MAFF 305830]